MYIPRLHDVMTRWVAMESNPEVWNQFITKMGVASDWQFTDVWGLDPDLLMMVPQPVAALLLLYPISPKTEKLGNDKLILCDEAEVDSNVFFMKQTVGNACGTVAIIHSLLNNVDRIDIGEELKTFRQGCAGKSADERAKMLETNSQIAGKHAEAASCGQTVAPGAEERVNLHFVALVSVGGSLFELDGRKERPVNWGECGTDELLSKGAQVCKKYMACDPDEVRFTVVALSFND